MLRVLVIALSLVLACASAHAAPLVAARCADGGSSEPTGIGGTGAHPGDSGIGGTGRGGGDDDGIGGTGRSGDDGIGGTGRGGDDDGIGGTGIHAEDATGVVGTITGFGSICVGGLELHYDATTPLRIDGQVGDVTRLAVGQVVEVVASGSGAELRAREIAVQHLVVGPVTGADAERGVLAVAGQTVELAGGDVAAHPIGSVVRVSGMRRADGVVVASRVTSGSADERVRITGPLAVADGRLTVGGTPLATVGQAARLQVGEEVRVVGTWRDGAVRADSVHDLPGVAFAGRVARLDVEGFARVTPSGELWVGTVPIGPAADAPDVDQLRADGARLRLVGALHGRRVVVDRVEALRDVHHRPGAAVPRGQGDHHGGPRDAPPQNAGVGDESMYPSNVPPGGQAGAPSRPEGRGAAPERVQGATRPDAPARPDVPQRPDRPQRPDVPRAERPPRPPDRPPRPPSRPFR